MNAARKRLGVGEIGAKPGSQLKVEDAQAIAELVKQRGGSCTAQQFVDESRARDSPTHHLFEWNDALAGAEFRLEQARRYLRAVTVEVVTSSGTLNVRLMEAVDSDDEDDSARTYKFISDIARDPDEIAQVVRDAKRQLDAFRKKFSSLRTLPGFSAVLRAIDTLLSDL